MAQALFYSSTATQMTLTTGIGSGDGTCQLSSASGLPVSFPFKLLLDWNTAAQEVVHCTALSGTTATITRGQDGTTAQAHSTGAVVVHGVSAREFNDLEIHVGSSSGVHGLTGSVAGVTDTQTLTNKTLTAPTIGDFTNATHVHSSSATGGDLGMGAWTAYTPTVTGINGLTVEARYKIVGKICFVNIWVDGTWDGTTSPFVISLPASVNAQMLTGATQIPLHGDKYFFISLPDGLAGVPPYILETDTAHIRVNNNGNGSGTTRDFRIVGAFEIQ